MSRTAHAALACLTLLASLAPPARAAALDPWTRAGLAASREPALHAAAHAMVNDRGELDVFVRGDVTRAELEAAGARVRTSLPGLCTAWVPAGAVARIAALPGVRAVRLAAPAEPELSVSVPATGATLLRGAGPAFAGLNGHGVLVGDVDTGVDFGHGDFRGPTGTTRFAGLWDQVAPGIGDAAFPYGRMWTPAEIDAGLCTEADSSGHGTHVMGIAGGDGSQTGGGVPAYTHVGMAPCADLAMVKTNFSTAGILDGVKWIFDLAAARGENAVVNLSLGTQYGPHDGSSEFEQGLAALTGPGRIVVKSAGNDRGAARHAATNATVAGATITLSVSGTAVGRSLAIDGYYDVTERLRVRVTTPGGQVIGPLAIGAESAPYPGVATTNGAVYAAHDSLPTGRRNVYIEINALTSAQTMNGTWTFTFLADQTGAANGLVDLWRFWSSTGLTANFVGGNQPTRELISEPGNAAAVITVGSYVTRTSWVACNGTVTQFGGTPPAGALSSFSSPGPTRDGRMKPDLVAPGDAILSATNFDLAVACPGGGIASAFADDGANHTAMRGTSMAAPHVAGAIALLLEKRGALTPDDARAYLAAHAVRDGWTGAAPGNDWGAGKLALGDLLDPVVTTLARAPAGDCTVGGTLDLTWSAHDSLGSVASVDLELSRTGPAGPWETIAAGVPNAGTYHWAVTGPATEPGAAYVRAIAHDTNGNTGSAGSAAGFTILGTLDAAAPATPAFALAAPRPNPATGATRFAFALPREAHVRLTIEDLAGRRVATLVDGALAAGRHEATWDAARVPPGLYFAVVATPAGRLARRVVVAR